MNIPSYVVITPSRNEAEYLPKTIHSMVSQIARPQRWIVVNDGSTDGTAALLDMAATEHSWIRVVHRPDRGFRKAGGGVIEAFYDGYAMLDGIEWDYLVKLDGDLSFASSYFSECIDHFRADEKLGIGGGIICSIASGGVKPEAYGDPPFHVRGAVKMYRRSCWEGIKGLHKVTGWDTIDEIKANMLGWTTHTFPELKVMHHRIAGAADGSWRNWVKNGRANYITGYHPLFMFVKCISRLVRKPYGLAAVGLCFGFLSGYFQRIAQVDDRALIKYLHRQQIRRLTFRSCLWTQKS